MATTDRITTAEQLFEAPDLGPCELVRGELIMVAPAGGQHGRIELGIGSALFNYATARGLGAAYGADTGFLIHRDPDTVRSPDAAFVRAERVPEEEPRGYIEGAADLAVEVISPNDRASEVIAKVQDWLDAGCRLVWLVDPKSRTVTAYRSRTEIMVLGTSDTLTGGDVLPGFSLPLNEIFGR
jgi:Uma2 family endonuclease